MDERDLIARFPPDFVFGVATAAYQIEGAATEGGRKPSIWDAFAHTPGRVLNGDTGDVACDHYHRFEDDLALAASLGVDAYRFSIAWPRVVPDGRGKVNAEGLDFYDRLVDGALRQGLKPFATLYHWDLPIELHGRGGWANRQTAEAFAEYADVVTRRLGDRLASIATLNEPWCSAFLGYLYGIHAPGEKNMAAMLAAAHHLLLGHGLALAAIRAQTPQLPAGIVLNPKSILPASDSAEDVAAAHRHHTFHNALFMDPLFKGAYPEELINALGEHFPAIAEGDLATISAKLDFLGVNYYNPERIADAPQTPYPSVMSPALPDSTPVTAMGWEISPSGLVQLIERMQREWRLPPIYITENGAAFADRVQEGRINDFERRDYIRDHLAAVAALVSGGCDVRGYFAWSLLDNFEWAEGYTKRFGIVHVDYETQTRTVKESGLWLRRLLAERKRILGTGPSRS